MTNIFPLLSFTQLEEMLTEKNSKIKQLEDQLAKQRDYEQIKNELK